MRLVYVTCCSISIPPPGACLICRVLNAKISRAFEVGPKLAELAGLRFSFEQDVNLQIAQAKGLWQPPVTPDKTQRCRASEEETGLSLPVLRRGAEHTWGDPIDEDPG